MTKLHQLHKLGQSTWLNYMRRSFIQSGELRSRMASGIQGITANANILEKTITACTDYDAAVQKEVAAGTPARRIHEALMTFDGMVTADYLHPLFESSDGKDGFVSLELDPALIHDTTHTVAAVRHQAANVNRVNAMFEVPATPSGLEAVRQLVGDGQNVNITHIFSVDVFEKAAQAYIAGLEYLFFTHGMWRFLPVCVASFSVSAIDSAVDDVLAGMGHPELQGNTAIAMAKVLYHRFHEIFRGPRWEKLARRNAQVLRPKWTRTTPRNFNYPATHYIDALIGPDTVTTFSPATLNAFLEHGTVASTLEENLEEARTHLARLEELGIDLDDITSKLQKKYLIASEKQFQAVIQSVSRKRDELESDKQPMVSHLGQYQAAVDTALDEVAKEEVMCRIWAHDHTLWKPEPAGIRDRLGWLHLMDIMLDNVEPLQNFTQSVLADGYTHALLIGMGGSSLAPELFHKSFGKPAKPPYMPHPYLELQLLDTTDSDTIMDLKHELNLTHTLVVVATKSGSTVETISGFKYFYNQVVNTVGREAAGDHFVAITDPGSPLLEIAAQHNFRQVFINDANTGGRYSALSFFGLVPAALVGADLETLLSRAATMASNTEPCHPKMIGDNLAARLGVTLGELARHGRNKVTFIPSLALASFGDWVEQLIAESTGKEGRGIVPVVGEKLLAPDGYGADRLFVHLRLHGDKSHDTAVQALIDDGQPVVQIHVEDMADLGGQFFLWQMATAVAGHRMQINPFDQPDVESAKVRARQMVEAYKGNGGLMRGEFSSLSAETLHQFLKQVRPGDYIALQAFVQRTPATEAALQSLREMLQEAYKVATTAGYGPRFLHSTGQLHKGDSGQGLFIQLLSDPESEVSIPDVAGQAKSTLPFSVLKAAQALGDAQALQEKERRLIRFHLDEDVADGLRRLAQPVATAVR